MTHATWPCTCDCRRFVHEHWPAVEWLNAIRAAGGVEPDDDTRWQLKGKPTPRADVPVVRGAATDVFLGFAHCLPQDNDEDMLLDGHAMLPTVCVAVSGCLFGAVWWRHGYTSSAPQ